MLFTIQQITITNKKVLSYKHKNQSTQKQSGEDHCIRSKSRSTSQSHNLYKLRSMQEKSNMMRVCQFNNNVSEGERDDMAQLLKTQTPT